MSIHQAMREACAAVGIGAPHYDPRPGQWLRTDDLDKRRGNKNGAVTINDDMRSGCAWNHTTGQHQRFWVGGASATMPARQRDPGAERRAVQERIAVSDACGRIVRACATEPHPYLAAKGFPEECGLVIDDPRGCLPAGDLGAAMARALPNGGPFLVVPGWVGKKIATVQFITPDGDKKNILRGQMGGAAHRIATGRETWVCEGIATAFSVRAALRLLGRSATIYSAFSAQNVGKFAKSIPGAIVAADHDKPLDQFQGRGTGEFYAAESGCRWMMPPERGDFNDMHMRDGLRAVALEIRKAVPP